MAIVINDSVVVSILVSVDDCVALGNLSEQSSYILNRDLSLCHIC